MNVEQRNVHVFREASIGDTCCAMAGGKEGWVRGLLRREHVTSRKAHPQLQVEPLVGALVGGQKGSVSTCEWCLGCDANISVGILPHSVR